MKLINNRYGSIKFHEDPNDPGVMVADKSEATREQVRVEIRESNTLGPGWVKIPVSTPSEESQAASWRAWGLSPEEARLAAGGGPASRSDDAGTAFRKLLNTVR